MRRTGSSPYFGQIRLDFAVYAIFGSDSSNTNSNTNRLELPRGFNAMGGAKSSLLAPLHFKYLSRFLRVA
jgi:hypothetical protein